MSITNISEQTQHLFYLANGITGLSIFHDHKIHGDELKQFVEYMRNLEFYKISSQRYPVLSQLVTRKANELLKDIKPRIGEFSDKYPYNTLPKDRIEVAIEYVSELQELLSECEKLFTI